jgi:hypothetical protein
MWLVGNAVAVETRSDRAIHTTTRNMPLRRQEGSIHARHPPRSGNARGPVSDDPDRC